METSTTILIYLPYSNFKVPPNVLEVLYLKIRSTNKGFGFETMKVHKLKFVSNKN
jgi:hypothetical protein